MEKDYTKLLLAHCCALIAMIYSERYPAMLERIESDVKKIQEELLTTPT
jgi:hypothetical protein